MKKILVVGATSGVGAEVIKNLMGKDLEIIATSRDPENRIPTANVTWKKFDVSDSSTYEDLFEGVDRAFIMSPPGYADQYAVLAPLIEEAQKHNLEKVVLQSAIGVDANDELPFRKAELKLESSGIPWAVIRPNWFFQNMNTFWIQGIKENGKIQLPAGDAATTFIDVRDIGEVATKLLLSDKKENAPFVLTGSQALTYRDVAEIISKEIGTTVAYEEISNDEFSSSLLAAGLPADYATLLVNLFDVVRAGYVGSVDTTAEQILGRSPILFADYVKSYRESWM